MSSKTWKRAVSFRFTGAPDSDINAGLTAITGFGGAIAASSSGVGSGASSSGWGSKTSRGIPGAGGRVSGRAGGRVSERTGGLGARACGGRNSEVSVRTEGSIFPSTRATMPLAPACRYW